MRATLDRKVREIMHYGVITVPERATAEDICRVMSDNQVSCVAVANASKDIVGVVSTTSIMVCGTRCKEGGWVRAQTIMSAPVIAVDADDSVQQAIETMVGSHVHRVMVRSDGDVVGVLSTSDVVREIGMTARGKPESVYVKLDRFEKGIDASGETEVAKETVYDVMTHGVMMIPMTLGLRETAKVMIAENRVHRVIVTSDEGEMIGVVAAIDILKPWMEVYGSADRDDVIAADVMTQNIEAVEHWRTLGEAMERMAGKHIHALLVLFSRGEISGQLATRPIMSTGIVHGVRVPIGLVSATDIVREIGKRSQAR